MFTGCHFPRDARFPSGTPLSHVTTKGGKRGFFWLVLAPKMNSDVLSNPRGWTDQVVSPVEETMKDCLRVAEELVEDDEDYSLELADLKRSMARLSELVYRTKGLGDVMLAVQQENQQFQSGMSEAPDLMETFSVNLQECANKAGSQAPEHPRMKEFEDLTVPGPSGDVQTSQEEPVGTGIVIGQVEVSLNCPLTKKLMEDPVTNKICSHSFSRQAVFTLIRQYQQAHRNKQTRCPIGGCNNKLKEADFEPNRELERAIRKKEREERRGRKEKNPNAVVV